MKNLFHLKTVKKCLRRKNLCFWDIGAHGGVGLPWKKLVKNSGYVKIMALEPRKESFLKLSQGKNIFNYCLAASSKKGKAVFWLNSSGSSVLRERGQKLENGRKVFVRTETLQRLRSSQKTLDILKIDTEGSEHAVLVGAGKYLRKETLAVQLEYEFRPRSPAQAPFHQVDGLLKSYGFDLYGITLQSGTSDEIKGGDALFIRNPRLILADENHPDKKTALIKLMVIYRCIGKNFPAFVAAQQGHAAGIFNTQEFEKIKSCIFQEAFLPHLLVSSPTLQKIARLLCNLGLLLAGDFCDAKSIPGTDRLFNPGLLLRSTAFFGKKRIKEFFKAKYAYLLAHTKP